MLVKIVVYDIAADSSGALGVLEDHYFQARNSTDEYIFLVSVPKFEEIDNVKVRNYPWVKKSWIHRLCFDFVVAPKLIKQIKPDYVLSLQNTIIPRVKSRQIVYEHNCIPKAFTDYRFSFVREPELWVRQNVIGRIIERSLKEADRVIVQTKWMKDRCINNLNIAPETISVEPPVLKVTPKGLYSPIIPVEFLYPSTGFRFKNHILIIEAVKLLQRYNVHNYIVRFTLGENESKYVSELKKLSKDLPIEYIGWQSRDDLFELYSRSVILFASKLESFPLPLVESREAHCPIIAPNCEYAVEALSGYENKLLFDHNDPCSLANSMREIIQNKGRIDPNYD